MNFSAKTTITCMLLFLLLGCGGKVETVTVVPPKETPWNQEEFNTLREKWIDIEASKELSTLNDEEHSLIEDLFFLSVDGRNRDIDYSESYKYAHILMKLSEEGSTSFHSWILVLNELSAKSDQIDTLTHLIETTQNEVVIHQDSINVLKNNLQTKNHEIKALQEQVNSQSEVIEKLKKLEMLMEKERKRFQ